MVTVENQYVYVISILIHVSYHIVFLFPVFQLFTEKIFPNGVFSQRKKGQ